MWHIYIYIYLYAYMIFKHLYAYTVCTYIYIWMYVPDLRIANARCLAKSQAHSLHGIDVTFGPMQNTSMEDAWMSQEVSKWIVSGL